LAEREQTHGKKKEKPCLDINRPSHGRTWDKLCKCLTPARDIAARKVSSAARAILTDQIGFSAGCQRLNRALLWLSPYEGNLPTIIDEYMKAVVGLPIGSERLGWQREALREKDIVLESVNQRFRGRILETCWALIDRFGEPRHV
jgi:hypothetical protein